MPPVEQELGKDDLDDLARPEGDALNTLELSKSKGGGQEDDDKDELDLGDVPPFEGKEREDKTPKDEEEDPLDTLSDDEEGITEEAGQGNDQSKASVLSRFASQLLQQHTGAPVADIPKDLDQKGLLSLLQEKLAPKLHPAAAALQSTIDKGGTVEQFLENFTAYDNMLAQSDEQLVALDLTQRYGKNDKTPHGLSEDGIKARVAKMKESGDLELRAIELRNFLSSEKNKQMQQMAAPAAPAPPVDVTTKEFKEGWDSDFKKYAEPAFASQDLFGITHTNKEKFVAAMKDLAYKATFPDKETRAGKFQTALKDPAQFVKIAALYELAQSGKLALDLKASKRNVAREVAAYLDKDARPGKAKSRNNQDGGFNASDLNDLVRPSLVG